MDSYQIFIILLALIPAIISIGIFIYTFYFLEKTNLILVFSFLIITTAIWQLNTALIRFMGDFDSAMIIYRTLFFGTLFTVPASLHFSLLYANKLNRKRFNLILTVIYLPSCILFLCSMFNVLQGTLVKSELWGYIYVRKGILDAIIPAWLGIMTMITMVILIRNYFTNKDANKNKAKGALLLAVGFAIPALMGLLFQVVFPLIFNIKEIPLTTTSLTIFSVATIVSLVKYNLFEYSPFSVIQQIFDSIQEGILITNNKGIIKYSNKSFYSIYGYKQDDLLGQSIMNLLVDNDDMPKMITHLDKIKVGKSSQLELLIKHIDKSESTSLINSYPYLNNKKETIGMLSLCLDISELKAREKQLQISESKLAQSQKIAGVGFIIWDLKTKLIETSVVTNKIYGLTLNKKNISDKVINNAIHADDREKVQNIIQHAIKNKGVYNIEHRIIQQSSNKIVWVKTQAEIFYDDKHQPTHLIGTVIDISQEKQYEKNMLIAMIEGEEKEKTRIAQELHDGIAQYMAAINMSLNSIKDDIPKDVQSYFDKTQQLVIQAITETRNISHNLLPKEINHGLEVALKSIVDKHDETNSFKICLNFKAFKDEGVSRFVKFNLYRITQEFYSNSYKYANAKNLNINISTINKQLVFIIEDDGDGFEMNNALSYGIGLTNMSQRAKSIGSIFNFTSKKNKGTRLEITIQLKDKPIN